MVQRCYMVTARLKEQVALGKEMLVHRIEQLAHGCWCRTPELAAASEIKDSAYTPADVMELFAVFRRQAADSLLFLKSVRSVAVHVRPVDGSAPQLLFRVGLSPAEVVSHEF